MEAVTLEEKAGDYFASMSHLACKMMQYNDSVKEMYRDTWDDLSWDKQEQLLDQHIIDPKLADKYSTNRKSEEQPSCFPVLKISSGEKIIVDFEHENGWTWTDEHSAPFSWKSKSQQDLTLASLDDANNSKEEQNKKNRVPKKTRSPDRSMFDSVILNGERNKNEVEKMFEKFGIKVAGDSDGDDSEGKTEKSSTAVVSSDADITMSPSHLYNEHSRLLGSSSDALDDGDFLFDSYATGKNVDVQQSVSQSNPVPKTKESKSKGQGSGKKVKAKGTQEKGKVVKEKTNKKKKTSNVSQSNKDGSDFNASSSSPPVQSEVVSEFSRSTVLETTAPIQFEEIGESSTDDLQESSVNRGTASRFESPEMTYTSKPNEVFEFEDLHDDAVVITSQPKKFELGLESPNVPRESDDAKNESIIKTGFDFLDNW